MARLRVTLEVDPIKLFDRLAAMKGDTSALGARLGGLLMTGEASVIDRVGLLAAYDIEVTAIKKINTATAEKPAKRKRRKP